ncbi:DNA repair [Micractinium conductrix]|uniref:DNA repair n=1 Tax=Micractinium conductrix TaxID=554055 RepID=A0A2P6V855_9CHLO|nr:DNA repair [Micractinium conductrix]|eukprot:PSC70265.1 DNA repair [Micractinium conductrix]
MMSSEARLILRYFGSLPRDAFNKPVGKVAGKVTAAVPAATTAAAPALRTAVESVANAAHTPALGPRPAASTYRLMNASPTEKQQVGFAASAFA